MLKITVELLPHGNENASRVIGVGTIVNDGTGAYHTGNYDVEFSDDGGRIMRGKVHNHARLMAPSVWTLVGKAISAAMNR